MPNAEKIIDPLTPSDCDLRGMPFMPLHGDELFNSTTWITCSHEARCAAIRLWWHSFAHSVPAASLPDDDSLLSEHAGYGVAVKSWMKIKAAALRGWVRCSDGRLYHPFVAKIAIEAWSRRQDQRWRSEIARIRKHNQRHGTNLPVPSFQEWLSHGCPVGHDDVVPKDNSKLEADVPKDNADSRPGCPAVVPRETHSKGQGQGQGQGIKEKKAREEISLPGFDEFFELYPKSRRADRKGCRKKWVSENLEERSPEIIRGLKRHISCKQWREKIIPLMSTFINQSRWELEPDQVEDGEDALSFDGTSTEEYLKMQGRNGSE